MDHDNRPPKTTSSSNKGNRRWLLAGAGFISLAAVVCLVAYLALNIWSNMSVKRDKRAAEALIGASLPDEAEDFHYRRWEPSEGLAFYTVYIKFESSEEAFRDLVRRMSMDLRNSGGADLMFLPAAWETEPGLVLDWWVPSQDTPAESAATVFGENGWIVAKYEAGYVYMIVTDSDFFD